MVFSPRNSGAVSRRLANWFTHILIYLRSAAGFSVVISFLTPPIAKLVFGFDYANRPYQQF